MDSKEKIISLHQDRYINAFVEEDVISCVIFDREDRPFAFESLHLQDKSRLSELAETVGRAAVFFVSPVYHLLPESLYQAGKDAIYLDALTSEREGMIALPIHIPEGGIKGSFDVSVNAYTRIRATLPDPVIRHFTEPYFTTIAHWFADPERDGVCLHVFRRHIHLCAFKSGRLVISVIYPYKTKEDALYHILAVYRHCRHSPEDVPLLLSGDIAREGELYKLIWNYIRDPGFHQPDTPGTSHPISLAPHQLIVYG